jgi:signal peptidase II
MEYAPQPELPQPQPQAEPARQGSVRARPLDLWIIGIVVLLDQASKAAIRMYLPLYEKVHVIPGLLDFTHVQNTGAAFGILNAADFPYKGLVMTLVATIALIAIGMYSLQLAPHERIARLGLALILGGAVGNLVDRALAGYVVDFIDVYWGTMHFWAFNVADASITAGAVLVIVEMLGMGRHASGTV